MEPIVQFVIPALVGLFIGVLSGLLGIGGGTVMVPVFRLLFDMSAIMSTATSLFAIIPTSISGALSHVRHKTCIPSLGIAAGMVVAALIIGWSAVKMLSKAIKMKPAQPEPATSFAQAAGVTSGGAPSADSRLHETSRTSGAASASNMELPSGKLTRNQLLIGVAIGLGAGVASGYVGVGGGFIMVPLMLSLVGISMRQASGTSLIAVMILAIPGTIAVMILAIPGVIEQALLGNINYLAGIAISIGSIPGAIIGARLVHRVPERTLRFIFGGFLIVAAALLVLNEFGILG